MWQPAPGDPAWAGSWMRPNGFPISTHTGCVSCCGNGHWAGVDVEAGCCLILVAFICLLSDIYKQWTKFAHFTYLSASSISTCYFFTFQVKFRAVLGSLFNFSFPTRNVSTQDQNLIPSVLLHLEGSWSLFCPLGGSYLHTEPLLQSVFWKEIPLGCDASETCLM